MHPTLGTAAHLHYAPHLSWRGGAGERSVWYILALAGSARECRGVPPAHFSTPFHFPVGRRNAVRPSVGIPLGFAHLHCNARSAVKVSGTMPQTVVRIHTIREVALKKILLFFVAVVLLFTSCRPVQLQSSTPTISATVTKPAPTASPTPIVPTWKDTLLIDSQQPVILTNETQEYQRKEIYGSDVVLEKDTHWIIDVQVDKLVKDVGESATAIKLLGYTEDGTIQQLIIVYQWGQWSIAYANQPFSEDNTFPYWQVFDNVTEPSQRFELTIPADRQSAILTNSQGYEVSLHFVNEKVFDGAQVITTNAQIGPQTKIAFSKLAVGKFQTEEAASIPGLPFDFPTSTAIASGDGGPQYIYHVAVNGNDANPGTVDRPFATIEHARDVIRTIRKNMQSSIEVVIHGGTYSISHSIKFDAKDSGQNGYDIIYRAAENETPIFSGGVNIKNWEKVPNTRLWKTTLQDIKTFRQMYVNGIRAQRAVSQTQVTGDRWVAGNFGKRDGIAISSAKIPDFSRPQDLELHWIYDWKDMRLPVKDVVKNANGTKTIWMKQPYYEFALRMQESGHGHYWIPKYDVPFYLENAYELLDEPGEWYYNLDTQELYYMPREGEEMSTANVVIPQAQNLLEITGGVIGQEVHNLFFDGLTFAYAGWTRASEIGTFGWQAQNLITRIGSEGDSYQEMTPAHVQVNSAHDIRFQRCRFEHLGAVGLDLGNNVYDVTVQGNLFHDISDGAIVVSHWKQAYITAPVIQIAPYKNLIANNLITDVAVEYWGAPAIAAYYVNNLHLVHNEISNISHDGIDLGWGLSFTKDSTTAHDNFIENNMLTDIKLRGRDGGGIYVSGQQPGTIIAGNVIRRQRNDYGCLYMDDGSAFITLRDNVCDTTPQWLFVQVPLVLNDWTTTVHDIQVLNNYTNVQRMQKSTVNVTDTEYINGQDWTPEAQVIMDNAGLEAAYSYLHDWLNK
jgi:hypothetical protein